MDGKVEAIGAYVGRPFINLGARSEIAVEIS